MKISTPPKIITKPILAVKSSWIDAAPFLIIILLLSLAAWCVRRKKSGWWRFAIRIASLFIFVFLIFRCWCILKLTVFNIASVGWDDLIAFGGLALFVIVGGFTLTFGRLWCGWICPLGFLQETTAKILPEKYKTIRLILLVIVLAAGVSFLIFYKPATDFLTENVIGLWALALIPIVLLAVLKPELEPHLARIRYLSVIFYTLVTGISVYFSEAWCLIYGSEADYSSILAFFVVILTSVALSMAWCRFLCPTGAFLSLFSRYSLYRIKNRCKPNCKESCDRICPVGALKKGRTEPSKCIMCGNCARKCGHIIDICNDKEP